MAKNDGAVEAEGTCIEVLPGQMYRIKLSEHDHTLLAYASGKMKKNKIRVLEGDKVTVEMSPYDMTRGRVTFRFK